MLNFTGCVSSGTCSGYPADCIAERGAAHSIQAFVHAGYQQIYRIKIYHRGQADLREWGALREK